MIKLLVFVACLATVFADDSPKTAKATVFNGKDLTKKIGEVTFTKTDNGIEVGGTIEGLTPGEHGFHIHEKGDISEGCASSKGHFNPHNKKHGAPDVEERHVGDLGNIKADDKGVATIKIVDKLISLEGEHNIIGRAVVVHQDPDDLGKGGKEDSETTGHAGERVGCGVIA